MVRMEEVSRVFGIDDFSRQYFQKDPFIKSVQFRRKFELSVRRFYRLTPQELNRMNLDAVIHLAARTKVGESLKDQDPEGAVYVNVLGTARVLDAAREKRTKTVVVGACLVYRNSRSGGGVNERSAEHPLSPMLPLSYRLTIWLWHTWRPTTCLRLAVALLTPMGHSKRMRWKAGWWPSFSTICLTESR